MMVKRFQVYALAAALVLATSATALAQSSESSLQSSAEMSAEAPIATPNGPTSIPEVITTCTPVIDGEYRGDETLRGQCIAATQAFVTYIAGPPAQENAGQTAADLVFELAKLYQDGQVCLDHPTELPDAIALALPLSADEDQRALIQSISETIRSCQTIETGALEDAAPPLVSPE
ncbi:MAG: hypothetical protein ABL879_14835 [Devosia sp.]